MEKHTDLTKIVRSYFSFMVPFSSTHKFYECLYDVLLLQGKYIFQVLDSIIEGRRAPSQLSRMLIHLNSEQLPTYALNDILIAHPCPASVSRFSFKYGVIHVALKLSLIWPFLMQIKWLQIFLFFLAELKGMTNHFPL